ncbi:MAG: 50S ribosomal protein L25 [Candidatus Rifleibacteriota bacterium]
MAEFSLNAEVRNKTGKGDAKKLRANGRIPAVIYGKKITPVHVSLVKSEFDKIANRANRNSIYEINLNGSEAREVIVRDYQKDTLTHFYTHVDFQAIDKNEPIQVEVDLDFTGTPIGKKTGGIFTTLCKQVRVEALPEKIPQVIELDITNLDSGDSLHVSDIPSAEYKVITNPRVALCQISKIKEEVEEAAEEEATGEEATAEAAPAAAEPKEEK